MVDLVTLALAKNYTNEAIAGRGDVSSIIIHALSHTTKSGYEVPVLTDDDIVRAYNGVVAGNNVFVVDDLDTITIQVLDASSIDEVSVRLLFTDTLILTYKIGGEITAKAVSGGGGNVLIDDTTIEKNEDSELQLKDGGITAAKLSSSLKALTVSASPSNDKLITESGLAQYIASGNNGYPKALDGIDLNTIGSTGFYSCNVCTNRPTENNGAMIVIRNTVNTNTLVQIYFSYTADEMWVRHRDNSIWKNWERILKEGRLTKEGIISALGYTPVNEAELDEKIQASLERLGVI